MSYLLLSTLFLHLLFSSYIHPLHPSFILSSFLSHPLSDDSIFLTHISQPVSHNLRYKLLSTNSQVICQILCETGVGQAVSNKSNLIDTSYWSPPHTPPQRAKTRDFPRSRFAALGKSRRARVKPPFSLVF